MSGEPVLHGPATSVGMYDVALRDAPETLAIDAVFRENARFVGWVALRILGRDEDVDDVVQEVFVSAIRGLKHLREPAAIRAWLKTVTVRTAKRRLYKRSFMRMLRLDDEPEVAQIASSDVGPESRAMLKRVYAILDGVPVNERMAWTLRHVEGEALPAAAQLLGCSLATVKRRIAAAQAHIDKELGS